MSKLIADLSISLDGFVAGPDPSMKDPLGIGGMQAREHEDLVVEGRVVAPPAAGKLERTNAVISDTGVTHIHYTVVR
jgi:hypothetical protein